MKNITKILIGVILCLLYSCQYELPQEDCEQENLYWEKQKQEELQEMYSACPDKCDFGKDRKRIIKKYEARKKNCKF